MWVRRSAIRPVPPFARVSASAVAAARALLSDPEVPARRVAQEGFERVVAAQPALGRYLGACLAQPLDQEALALGRLLAAAVYVAFESNGARLATLSHDEVAGADAALGADEELRRNDPVDALESEDIVAIEQPALVAFVNEHVGATLEAHAGSIDVDHVALVFRAILVEILALSHAVAPPPGHAEARGEPMA